MNFFIQEKEIEIINPITKSDDNAIIVHSNQGKRDIGRSDLVKEITAIDALNLGTTIAAEVNGVPESSASKYSNTKDIDNPDVRARINQRKYDIAETATAKLMETLDLIDPESIDKEREKIYVATGLANIVEKLSDNNKNGSMAVHLHIMTPETKDESHFKVIDV